VDGSDDFDWDEWNDEVLARFLGEDFEQLNTGFFSLYIYIYIHIIFKYFYFFLL